MFGLIERYISAKMLELSRDYALGDQIALEALVRFTDEELKHQELFRRIENLIGAGMPLGYALVPKPNDVASAVLSKSTWSVLALTCLIELFTQAHYRASIEPDSELSPSSRTCSCSTGKRNRSTRSWTSWNGCAKTRSSRPRRAIRR